MYTVAQPPLQSWLMCLNFNYVASNIHLLNDTIFQGRRKLKVIQVLMSSSWLMGGMYTVVCEG